MSQRRGLATLCLLLWPAAGSVGQVRTDPHLGYVYPAGGRQGATFRVVLGGQYLDGVAKAYVSGAGVEATVLEYDKPLTQRQINELREKLKQYQEKRSAALKGPKREEPDGSQPSTDAAERVVWTAEDEEMLAEIRKKLADAPGRQANPAIAETVTLEITVAPEAEPGRRELRLAAASGLSNPLVFCVGQLPEFNEREPKGSAQQRNPQGARPFGPGARRAPEQADMQITLPAVVNGQILAGDVDRFRFAARQGQRLVVAVSARALIPYLADAVPGWFQATLALYDAEGNELAYADDWRFDPDPVLSYEVPGDGDYVIEIKDSIYRGREDFVYRIAVGELPFVTSIFPLGGRAGEPTSIELRGWNLPGDTLTHEPDLRPGISDLGFRVSDFPSHVPFAVDMLPECLELESNNSHGGAQRVTLPLIVNGRIDPAGDWDVFCFEGRAGDRIIAEVYARRLDSPLDSVLKLTDAAGRQLAANDDHEDKGAGLATHHAESLLDLVLPADGTCYLHLGDAQRQGGPAYGYRLRVSPPQPDFELRLVPSGLNARAGTTVPVTVYALRKDGFSGDIVLELKDAPAQFTLSGGWVPAHQDQVRATLTVPEDPPEGPVRLSLEGRATIAGRQVVRPVVPADDMMQAFFYRHLVPARDLKVTVTGTQRRATPVKVLNATGPGDALPVAPEAPVRIPAGGTARVRIAAARSWSAGQVQFELSEPPEGITIAQVTPAREGAELVLRSDAAKPGLKGNLIVQALARSAPAQNPKAKVNRPRAALATLPAIPFEIIEP